MLSRVQCIDADSRLQGRSGDADITDDPSRPMSTTQSGQKHHQVQTAAASAAATAARQLLKLKRFLGTLVQFGADISADAGAEVQRLVHSLVAGSLTVEQFRTELQVATNFPLRPFVMPFLRASLPLLQGEMLACSGGGQPGTEQLLMQLLRQSGGGGGSDPDGSEDVGEFGSVERCQKRRPSDSERLPVSVPPKRRHTGAHPVSTAQATAPSLPAKFCIDSPVAASSFGTATGRAPKISGVDGAKGSGGGGGVGGGGEQLQQTPAQTTIAASNSASPRQGDSSEQLQPREEWRQVESTLSAISDLIAQARRSIGNLQQQQQQQQQHPAAVPAKRARQQQQQQQQYMQQIDSIIDEVKRQAAQEVRLAVALADERAMEMLAMEKLRTERLLTLAREEAASAMREQSSSAESCWNCGRLASETCSGCSAARYCGSFCQHKDWEKHQKTCGVRLAKDSLASCPSYAK